LNDVFAHFEISVRKSFARVDEPTGRVVEQIDGVIELDGHLYLVEMKWLQDAVSVDDVSRHLVRVYHRFGTRAIFVADTEFSPGALEICQEALQSTVVVLVSIEELVRLLERESDLVSFLRKKIERAQLEKRPWVKLLAK
jgi:restriction system protein